MTLFQFQAQKAWEAALKAYRNAQPGYRLQKLQALRRAANAALRASLND